MPSPPTRWILPPLALASQTIIPRDGDGRFELALQQVPPPSAFVVTGSGRFLELPAEGNLAIGFITVSPWSDTGDAEFSWKTEDQINETCPFEKRLVVWWDGPELTDEETGFASGTLKKGLNLVDLGLDADELGGYRLFPADTPITVPVCHEGFRPPLRSCGLPGDRSVDTLFVSGSEDDDETMPPETDSYECGQCGTSYRVPDVCTRRFDILCRDCRSLVVETDPTDPPDDWICMSPPDQCDVGDEPICRLGTRYRCVGDQWQVDAVCGDPCCEDGCVSES